MGLITSFLPGVATWKIYAILGVLVMLVVGGAVAYHYGRVYGLESQVTNLTEQVAEKEAEITRKEAQIALLESTVSELRWQIDDNNQFAAHMSTILAHQL